MDSNFEFIPHILSKYNIKPLYTFEKYKMSKSKDFVIGWINFYSTPAMYKGKKVFLKILMREDYRKRLNEEVRFLELLISSNIKSFQFPSVISYIEGEHPFLIREFVEGEYLGFYDKPKEKFGSDRMINLLRNGFYEVQSVIPSSTDLWHKTKDITSFHGNLDESEQVISKYKMHDIISHEEFKEAHSIVESLKDKVSFDYVPIIGDPGPNNFLVSDGKIYVVDCNPFSLGNNLSDFAEFASFCIISKRWKKFTEEIKIKNDKEQLLYNLNLFIYLIDRIVTNCYILKQYKRKKQSMDNISVLKNEIEKVKHALLI